MSPCNFNVTAPAIHLIPHQEYERSPGINPGSPTIQKTQMGFWLRYMIDGYLLDPIDTERCQRQNGCCNDQRKGADMAETTKIVKGGFRATLALIISIIALFVSILAYTSYGNEKELNARIKDLQASMERMKQESAEQLNSLRNKTAEALEKMGQAVRQEESSKKQ
jgi:hypothetical protein